MWSWWDLSNTCGPGSVCLQTFITNSDILKEKSCESQAKYLFFVAKPWPPVLTDPDTVIDKTYCTVGETYLTLKKPDNLCNVKRFQTYFLDPLYLQWFKLYRSPYVKLKLCFPSWRCWFEEVYVKHKTLDRHSIFCRISILSLADIFVQKFRKSKEGIFGVSFFRIVWSQTKYQIAAQYV